MKKTKLGQALIKGMKEIAREEKKKNPNLKTWLIPKLRRLSQQWPPKNEAKKAARVSRGLYKCAKCNNLFGPNDVALDHVNPVVPLTGFEDLGNYVESLFCSIDGYQTLCHPCHDGKTEEENKIRQVKKTVDSK